MTIPIALTERLRSAARQNKVLRGLVRRRRAGQWLTDWTAAGAPGALDRHEGGEQPRKVLLGTDVAGHLNGTIVESALGAALRLRGHQVDMLLCDGLLPACLECTYVQISPDRMSAGGPQSSLCGYCHQTGVDSVDGLGITIHSFSDLVTPEERAEARRLATSARVDVVSDLTIDGLRVGEHALAGALRFFARATLVGEPTAPAVLRRYVEAAVLTTRVAQRLLRRERYDVAVFHHGIYVPQGLLGEVCRAEGVRVVNWNPGYRSQTFVFSHHDTYHHTLMEEPTSQWEDMPWDDQREGEVLDYLASRWTGARDWIYFHREPQQDLAVIEAEVGIDFSARPTVGLLTNVMWDAQLHYPANAFPTMLDWVVDTIRWFADHPEVQLLIRVHPAEITGWLPTRQPVVDEIRRQFPTLPENVYLVGPESHVSTYAAMLQCDSVVIYGTKTGVELTSLGIPVIVAGEAWIRGKGLTQDVTSREEYLEMLDALPAGRRMSDDQVRRARQYAYHFFFRRMIPLEFMRPSGVSIPVYRANVPDLDLLRPGASSGLDTVCDGITQGTPFVHDGPVRPKVSP
jgi:hypothetical protein